LIYLGSSLCFMNINDVCCRNEKEIAEIVIFLWNNTEHFNGKK